MKERKTIQMKKNIHVMSLKKKSNVKQSIGITLIALVITIIILLILAGVSISLVAGENGILTRASDAVVITEIKEIEENARLHYMDRKVDEITGGENATIAGVISDLKAEGYHIEERVSGATTVTGIVLNENSIKLNKNSEASLTYTLVYGEGTVKYYVEVRGKYYEIVNENENIVVRTEETNLEGIDNTPKVTVQSNAENIATARTGENDTIVINSLNELGETIVTVKEENSGTTVTCNVKVMTMIEQISFKQDTITIEKGNNVELSTLVTINPTDATEELIWTTGDGTIIEITEDGKLVGVKEGTTTIKVTNEAGTIEATCQVKVVISATGISLNKSTTTINKGNTDSLTVTLTPADTTDEVKWTTESTSIATITPDATGRTATITAVGAGTTKITVTCGSKTTYCTVTVKVPATGLTISQESAIIDIEQNPTLQLTATATPSDTTDTIAWKSSSTSVAIVSNSGLVTAVAEGTATITVTCGSQTKTCAVTVKEPTLLDKVKENPASFYGKKVTNYSANGISDWRIFYADDENVFLITTDYVPVSKIPKTSCGMRSYSNYSIYWYNIPALARMDHKDKFSPVTSETVKWSPIDDTNYNVKYVSNLLDTSKWTEFVDSNKALMAIGCPTLNMWVASWNTKYPNEKLYCNNTNQWGYYVGRVNCPTEPEEKTLKSMSGYSISEEDNLYFPHKAEVAQRCFGYWLSSPSAEADQNLCAIYSSGSILGDYMYKSDSSNFWGCRVVVCLKPDVKLEVQSES